MDLCTSPQPDSIPSTSGYEYNNGMKEWPLNKQLFDEIDSEYAKSCRDDYGDIVSVRPHRSQMRSVLIFAVDKANM
jgi:hypothetical protein